MPWDAPHADKPDERWYHPRTLLWLVIDIVYITLNYFREKHKSHQARRWVLELQIRQCMQNSYYIATDESLPVHRRRDAVKTLRKLKRMSEELNINNPYIDRYIDDYEDLKHLL